MSVPDLDELAAAIQSGGKYRDLHPDLVRRIAARELAKGRGFKDALKAARSKLHQMGGAYTERPEDYARLSSELGELPRDLQAAQVKAFCLKAMELHASSRERLPILSEFYELALGGRAIASLLDLACGLNPLALPWMPLAPGFSFFACDIYANQLDFLNRFFAHFNLDARAEPWDLLDGAPPVPAEAALLLKTIPCLEQADKTIGRRLLESLPAPLALVSFPAASLGGRQKGMLKNYEAHFWALLEGMPWSAEKLPLDGELLFLLRK